tara:strand:- start:622 stop:1092 length:471 start_codon:yes stop_codon:yes gene_type:complete
MLQTVFYVLCSIFIIIVLQNIFLQLFNVKIVREKFSVGYQNSFIKTDIDDLNRINASITREKNASNTMIHDSKISASSIESIFDTKNYNNMNNVNMDLRDLYTNLCPLDYHLNMIKLKDMVTNVNGYPGYSSDVFIDLTRQIKSDKPLPMSADFLK